MASFRQIYCKREFRRYNLCMEIGRWRLWMCGVARRSRKRSEMRGMEYWRLTHGNLQQGQNYLDQGGKRWWWLWLRCCSEWTYTGCEICEVASWEEHAFLSKLRWYYKMLEIWKLRRWLAMRIYNRGAWIYSVVTWFRQEWIIHGELRRRQKLDDMEHSRLNIWE